MAKSNIKKEITASGTVVLTFCNGKNGENESLTFENEKQLKAFSSMLSIMVSIGASTVDVG